MISPLAQKMIADGGVHAARIDIAPPPGQPALSEMNSFRWTSTFIEERDGSSRPGLRTYFSDVVTGAVLRHDHSGVCACDLGLP